MQVVNAEALQQLPPSLLELSFTLPEDGYGVPLQLGHLTGDTTVYLSCCVVARQ
jgi:hypothetical protein